MAKVKMLTSANRDGVALPNGSEQEFPETEAMALCRNGLASPVGWELPQADVGSASDSEGSLTDGDQASTPPAGGKSKKK